MNPARFSLKIIKQGGWAKSVEITRAITRLGSSAAAEIQINSEAIAPIHLQIHYSTETASTCKVLNLGGGISLRQGNQQVDLDTFKTTTLQNGDEVSLGEYRIQFDLPQVSRTIQSSLAIEATLEFPEPSLYPNQVTVGLLRIKNAGQQSACQFRVGLGGLPAECLQVDPVPLLFPGAQEEIRIRLTHHGLYPRAGLQDLNVTISAPESYPGEQVILRQGIYVTPVFEQLLEIGDDLTPLAAPAELDDSEAEGITSPDLPGTVESAPLNEARYAPQPVPAPTPEPIAAPRVESPFEAEPAPSPSLEPVAIAADLVPASAVETSKPKVVRSSSNTFWDEE